MKTEGWLFFAISWGIVILGTVWCLTRVLTSRKHWTHPDEDIKELHHGEFGEPVEKDK